MKYLTLQEQEDAFKKNTKHHYFMFFLKERKLLSKALLQVQERRISINHNNSCSLDASIQESLLKKIKDQYVRSKKKVAIKTPEGSLTYGELEKKVKNYTQYLKLKGIHKGHRIGVEPQQELNLIVYFLSILEIGASYVAAEKGGEGDKDDLDFYLFEEGRIERMTCKASNLNKNKQGDSSDLKAEYKDAMQNRIAEGKKKLHNISAEECHLIESGENLLLIDHLFCESAIVGIFSGLITGACICIPSNEISLDIDQLELFAMLCEVSKIFY